MKKRWWARVRGYKDDYGNWIPTGCVDREDARFYLIRIRRIGETSIVEWLEM
jgi:hypothetical protein